MKQTHAKYADQLEYAIVEDIAQQGAFDEAVRGVAGVIHTASPSGVHGEDNERDVLDPAIKGTTSVLESIAKNAPQVKRVVITSSFAAIFDLKQGSRPGYTYTENDWNPATYEEAKNGDGTFAYCASKAFAEQAALDFVKDHKPNFTVIAINPPMVYGPLAQKITIDRLGPTAADIWRFLDGSLVDQPFPPTVFPTWVDVRDVAQAHLKAYELDSKQNERYLITAGTYTYAEVASILRKAFPDRHDRIPDPSKADVEENYKVDNAKSRAELNIEYISLERSVADTAKSLLQVEAAGKKASGYDGQRWLESA